MDLHAFLRKLARHSGRVSVENGVVRFPDKKSFDLKAALKRKAFAVIQEGGASTELYLHSHESLREAEEDRVSCGKGAYQTSDIVEIPAPLTAFGELFYVTAENLIRGTSTLTCVESPEDEADEDEED